MAKTWQDAWQGTGIPASIYIASVGFRVQSLIIRNNSPITWTVSNQAGTIYDTVPAFYAQSISVPFWATVSLVGDGQAPAGGNSLTVTAYEVDTGGPFVVPFGPSAWGGGSIPNALQAISAGDTFGAWQIDQLINLLTGVMTGQPVTLADGLTVAGGLSLSTALAIISLLGGGKNWQISVDSTGQWRLNDVTDAVEPLAINASRIALGGWLDGQTIRSIGQAIPASGAGVEMIYAGGQGYILAFDRSSSTYKILNIGLNVTLSPTGRLTAPTTGASGKPLLNYVSLDPPVKTDLTATVPTNGTKTTVALNGLVASAVKADLIVSSQATPSEAHTVNVFRTTLDTIASVVARASSDSSAWASGSVATNAGIGVAISWLVGGTPTTTALLAWVKGYWEPS